MKLVLAELVCFAVICGVRVFGRDILCGAIEGSENHDSTEKAISRLSSRRTIGKLLEYRCRNRPIKPYVRQLFTPGGVQILRDSPGDHKHHHALMFAVKADNVDFWGEAAECRHRKVAVDRIVEIECSRRHRSKPSSRKSSIGSIRKPTKPLVQEVRRIEAFASPELKATLLSWHSTLEPAAGQRVGHARRRSLFRLGDAVRHLDGRGGRVRQFGQQGRRNGPRQRKTHAGPVVRVSLEGRRQAGDGGDFRFAGESAASEQVFHDAAVRLSGGDVEFVERADDAQGGRAAQIDLRRGRVGRAHRRGGNRKNVSAVVEIRKE